MSEEQLRAKFRELEAAKAEAAKARAAFKRSKWRRSRVTWTAGEVSAADRYLLDGLRYANAADLVETLAAEFEDMVMNQQAEYIAAERAAGALR